MGLEILFEEECWILGSNSTKNYQQTLFLLAFFDSTKKIELVFIIQNDLTFQAD
jgi:hypothetical protein